MLPGLEGKYHVPLKNIGTIQGEELEPVKNAGVFDFIVLKMASNLRPQDS